MLHLQEQLLRCNVEKSSFQAELEKEVSNNEAFSEEVKKMGGHIKEL